VSAAPKYFRGALVPISRPPGLGGRAALSERPRAAPGRETDTGHGFDGTDVVALVTVALPSGETTTANLMEPLASFTS
jgi:hypothetical protein